MRQRKHVIRVETGDNLTSRLLGVVLLAWMLRDSLALFLN